VTLPVFRASLPRARALAPYLERIDASGWYSNGGALARELEDRLRERCGGVSVRLASSGTAALEGAILAAAGTATPERPLALLPAYSFVATAIAARRCGYIPYLLDVDAESWALDPERLAGHPQLARAGVAIAVAPYGRAVAQAPWRAFADTTGVPVVIDAAAAIEAVFADPARCLGRIPVALSMQATKPLSTAEGGAIVWSDAAGSERARRALKFGFDDARECVQAGSNGKLSEYHAAVGLASLDAFGEYRTRAARVAARFAIAASIVVAPTVASTYALFHAASAQHATRVAAALADRGIETRYWYGLGIHRHEYFRELAADPLPVTDALAPRLVGLPCFDALTDPEIDAIVATVEGVPA
jgi:dTDP-4-amino-4,6-dideoxygalactose transaminase